MTPLKTAQRIFREWCGSWMIMMDPAPAADLVKRIEAALIARGAEAVLEVEAKAGVAALRKSSTP